MPADNPTDAASTAGENLARPATSHIANRPADRGLEPWRFVLVVTAILLAIPCGIAAAAPGWSGAELACLICLAIFVAAFTLHSKDSR